MRGSLTLKRKPAPREDRILNHSGVGQNLGVPKSQHRKSLDREEGIPFFIVRAFRMLRTVRFDD